MVSDLSVQVEVLCSLKPVFPEVGNATALIKALSVEMTKGESRNVATQMVTRVYDVNKDFL